MTLRDYLKQLEADFKSGQATEHTYRPALKRLLEHLFPNITATNEPKRIKAGAPDYVITQGQTPLGYIEAKDLGRSLDDPTPREKAQRSRYLSSLENIIFTDYLEFRWYVGGQLRTTASLGTLEGKRIKPLDGGEEAVRMLLTGFIETTAPTLKSPAELAKKMAALAQQIRYTILSAFNAEDLTDDRPDPLNEQYAAFKDVLLDDLTPEQFADMYAQTITYGMFAARSSPNFTPPFTREKAAYDIPKTNPFLRTIFTQMVGPDLESSVDWIVDDLVNLLSHADIAAILADFGARTRTEDPVVHFYETFLAAYDPKMREARGVYYTPEPVVSYIVRSVDAILKRDFKLPDGLADTSKVKVLNPETRDARKQKKDVHKVQILDPATGTATFLHAVIGQIHQNVVGQLGGNKGMWSGYVKNELLPRLHGFELLMAPYTVAHMKLGLQLAEMGYDFASDERLGIYLTNALEEAHQFPSLPLFGAAIARESQEAGRIKQDAPVMVVLGNPPYSGHSANNGAFIYNLLRGVDTVNNQKTGNYFEVDGAPLGEKNPKWLNDDYVKFIRLSQWRIEQTGYGILAFVTNHGYLDNPTFRGMRQSLMETFDDLYLLDLHGNAKKKEKTPEGGKDENVFDIMQGVAIGLFVKKPNSKEQRVFKADMWGVRDGKYRVLLEQDVQRTAWQEIEPKAPYYLFAARDEDIAAEYEQGHRVSEIFPVNSVGIVTARDSLTIHWTQNDAWQTVNDFAALPVEEARQKYNLGKDARDWKVELAQKDLKDSGLSDSNLHPIHYRPFDIRHTYYTGVSRGFHCMPRGEVMGHMLAGENLGLQMCRQVISETWQHILVTQGVTDDCHVSNKTRERGYVLPLYLYPTSNSLFTSAERTPNLSPDFIADVSQKLGLAFIPEGRGDLTATFSAEDTFFYIYALFHAPSYRSRYAEFLKIDFPRVPLTSSLDLFNTLVTLGERLVSLHLMESFGQTLTSYPVEGDNVVDAPRFVPNQDGVGRVYINKTQYFDGVPAEVWNFYVGGYQVLHKWLKDRKGRSLQFDDLRHYGRIVGALAETIKAMAEIDAAIDSAGGWPLVS